LVCLFSSPKIFRYFLIIKKAGLNLGVDLQGGGHALSCCSLHSRSSDVSPLFWKTRSSFVGFCLIKTKSNFGEIESFPFESEDLWFRMTFHPLDFSPFKSFLKTGMEGSIYKEICPFILRSNISCDLLLDFNLGTNLSQHNLGVMR